MRWKFKPVPVMKTVAATLSMWTMCIAPVAQGAEAARNKQLISQYLKDTGLTTKKQTIGEFWAKVRHVYPTVLQKQLDPWMSIHKNELMPTIEASSFKDSDNKEQVRLLLISGSESNTLTFTGDDDKPLKVNGVTLTYNDLADYNHFDKLAEKIANQDPKLKNSMKPDSAKNTATPAAKTVTQKRFLKGNDLAKMNLRQQMDYFLKMREAVQAADKVLSYAGKPTKGASFNFFDLEEQDSSAVANIWQVLLGVNAVAKVEQACIASGWVASYYKGSCARPEQGQASLLRQVQELPFNDTVKAKVSSCAKGGGLPCNPLLFGFSDSSGSPICITSNLPSATKQCNEATPLPGSKEKIIQSIVAARGGDGSICKLKDDTVSQACADKLEKYTQNLQQHYLNAAGFCTKGGVTSIENAKEWESKARKDIAKDQKEACENLKDRFFDLKIEVAGPVVAPACEVAGANRNEKGDCVCSDGKPPRPPTPQPKSSRGGKSSGKSLPNPSDVADSGSGQGQLTCDSGAGTVIPDDGPGRNLPGGKDVAKGDECGFLCKYKGVLIAVGVGLVGLGLFWWLTKKKTKKSSPEYVAPAPPPLTDPSPTATATATTTVSPVPSNPCPAGNTVVNGVCTPDVIVTPPTPPVVTTPTTEGGSGTGNVTGGATR